MNRLKIFENKKSNKPKKRAVKMDTNMTTSENITACLLVGQFTWDISILVSLK